jgi:predicted GIY-YIG superfamily endonuclease
VSRGTVYLLHFERPLHHAQHYLGYTAELEERLDRHRAGTGARIVEVVTERGIPFALVRTWAGTRKLERRLKRRRNARLLCPTCYPAKIAAKLAGQTERRRRRRLPIREDRDQGAGRDVRPALAVVVP